MSTVSITCPHCARSSQIDAAQLPDQPVSLPCPHCQGRVVVDRRKFARTSATPAVEPPAPVAVPQPVVPAVAAEPASTPALTLPVSAPSIDRPSGAAGIPSGVVVGDDEQSIREIRDALLGLGSRLEIMESAEAARQAIVNDRLELCIYVAGSVDATPHPGLSSIGRLDPGVRRGLYLVLVGDNLKTADGKVAFLHGANLVLARNDVPRLGDTLARGIDYHRRLYADYFEASRSSSRD